MKTFWIFTLIASFLLFCSNRMQAQTTSIKLDQMELMKQYLGIWKGEMAKDTVMILNFTSFGKTIEDNYKVVTKEKILFTGKEIYGYDKKYDKLVIAAINDNSTRLSLSVGWFSSKDTGNIVGGYQYLSNPEKSSFKSQWILIQPDKMKRIIIQNKMVVSESILVREK
jgi:hypothetical protein